MQLHAKAPHSGEGYVAYYVRRTLEVQVRFYYGMIEGSSLQINFTILVSSLQNLKLLV